MKSAIVRLNVQTTGKAHPVLVWGFGGPFYEGDTLVIDKPKGVIRSGPFAMVRQCYGHAAHRCAARRGALTALARSISWIRENERRGTRRTRGISACKSPDKRNGAQFPTTRDAGVAARVSPSRTLASSPHDGRAAIVYRRTAGAIGRRRWPAPTARATTFGRRDQPAKGRQTGFLTGIRKGA
jgi:hypothetical protein